MNDITIADDLLPKGYADAIEAELSSVVVPWTYIDDVTSGIETANPGFVHCAFDAKDGTRTDWYPFLRPLVYHIEAASGRSITELLRIRIGLLNRSIHPNGSHNTPHVDYYKPHVSACYYVTDSDGDTVLFTERLGEVGLPVSDEAVKSYLNRTSLTVCRSCPPKRNRALVFDGDRFHASTHPRVSRKRLVIAINFV